MYVPHTKYQTNAWHCIALADGQPFVSVFGPNPRYAVGIASLALLNWVFWGR